MNYGILAALIIMLGSMAPAAAAGCDIFNPNQQSADLKINVDLIEYRAVYDVFIIGVDGINRGDIAEIQFRETPNWEEIGYTDWKETDSTFYPLTWVGPLITIGFTHWEWVNQVRVSKLCAGIQFVNPDGMTITIKRDNVVVAKINWDSSYDNKPLRAYDNGTVLLL